MEDDNLTGIPSMGDSEHWGIQTWQIPIWRFQRGVETKMNIICMQDWHHYNGDNDYLHTQIQLYNTGQVALMTVLNILLAGIMITCLVVCMGFTILSSVVTLYVYGKYNKPSTFITRLSSGCLKTRKISTKEVHIWT